MWIPHLDVSRSLTWLLVQKYLVTVTMFNFFVFSTKKISNVKFAFSFSDCQGQGTWMEEALAPGPNFNRPVKDLVYKDLLTSTFTNLDNNIC